MRFARMHRQLWVLARVRLRWVVSCTPDELMALAGLGVRLCLSKVRGCSHCETRGQGAVPCSLGGVTGPVNQHLRCNGCLVCLHPPTQLSTPHPLPPPSQAQWALLCDMLGRRLRTQILRVTMDGVESAAQPEVRKCWPPPNCPSAAAPAAAAMPAVSAQLRHRSSTPDPIEHPSSECGRARRRAGGRAGGRAGAGWLGLVWRMVGRGGALLCALGVGPGTCGARSVHRQHCNLHPPARTQAPATRSPHAAPRAALPAAAAPPPHR